MAKKRVYEVVNNSPHKRGLRVGKNYYRYGRNGVFTVKDPDIGKEIKSLYDGMDAVVNEVEMSTNLEPGHKYTFSGIDIPKGEYVTVWDKGFRRITREDAKRLDLKIVSQKHDNAARGAEVKNGN